MSTAADVSGGRRTALYVVLGVLVVLALAGGALLLLRPAGEGSAAEPLPVPTAPVVVQPAPSPVPNAAPTPSDRLADSTFQIFEARDPFDQLVTEDDDPIEDVGTGASSSGTGGSGTPAATPTSPSFGQPAPSTSPPLQVPPPGQTPAPTPSPTSSAQVGGTSIVLVDTYTDEGGRETVQVAVNGTGYDVHEGETFANENGRVVSIDAPCATIEYRDSRMTLCEGDEIRK